MVEFKPSLMKLISTRASKESQPEDQANPLLLINVKLLKSGVSV